MKTITQSNLLSEIFSNFGQMVWSKEVETGITSFLTDNFSEVFEIPMDLLRMNPSLLRTCIHPDEIPFVDVYSKSLLTNNFEEIDYRIITPQGTIKWIHEKKQLTKDVSGKIIRLDVLLREITSQKKEEKSLIESESTFKTLFFKNPNPMWVYDTQTLYFLAVNDAAVQFYGYTHDEFFRMTVRQIRPHGDVNDFLEAIRSNTLDSYKQKIRKHIKKDGSFVYVRLTSSSLNFRGHTSRMVMANDISDQMEAEIKTEKLNRYLEGFQEAISQNSLLALMDYLGNLTFINQNFLKTSGTTPENVIGKPWTILQSHIYKSEQSKEIVKSIRTKEIWRGERKLFRKNGNHFWASCAIIPILKSDDDQAQFLLVANDISGLKEAEKRNREYAIKLHNIIEGVTDAIFVLDKNWILTNVNGEAEKLFNTKRNTLVGKNIWEILPDEEATKFYQFFRKAKKRKITVQFEEYFEPTDQWYDISIYPSKDGLAVCFRNVTERRRKEVERKELMEQLIHQNIDLEEFTFITSHSLRAHIANISMLCSVINTSGLTPANQEVFEKLFQTSSNLNSVIEDLSIILNVKDRNPILKENISIQNSYVNALAKIPNNFSSLKKFIRTDIEEGIQFYSYRMYFESILTQLLTNCLKFRSLNREPLILFKVSKGENALIISIKDNGMGLDVKTVEKQLFHLYKTFHTGISGKGLGLYLCKILTQELKGEISILSEPDKGTELTLEFPLN